MSLLLRWRLYWAALVALLVGVSFYVNLRRFPHLKLRFVVGKTLFEISLAALLAWSIPPLLIAYCVLWLSQFISPKPVVRVAFSVMAGLAFGKLAVWALEVLLLIGSLAMTLISESFAKNLRRVNAQHP